MEIEVVEPGGDDPGHDLAEHQVVGGHRALVGKEEPPLQGFRRDRHREDGADVEALPQPGVQRHAPPARQSRRRLVEHGAPGVGGVGAEEARAREGLGDQGAERLRRQAVPGQAPLFPGRDIEPGLLPLDPGQQRAADADRPGGVLEQRADQGFDPLRFGPRPGGDPRHVPPRPVLVRSEVAQQDGGHHQVDPADDQRIDLKGGIRHHHREIEPHPQIGRQRGHRRPQRSPQLPAQGGADEREHEIRGERARGAGGEVDEEREEDEIEAVRDQPLAVRRRVGAPDQRRDQQGIDHIGDQQGVGDPGVLRGLGGIEPDREQRGAREDHTAAGDQAFGAALGGVQRFHERFAVLRDRGAKADDISLPRREPLSKDRGL